MSPGRVRVSRFAQAFAGSGFARRRGPSFRTGTRGTTIHPMIAYLLDMAPPTVKLVPLTPEAWDAWRSRSIRDYADEKVRAGTWGVEAASGLAADELAQLLPEGPATPGNELRSIVNAEGVIVGSIWIGPKGPDDRDVCFVWDIHIDPGARGRGYGRAAMLAAKDLARSMGSRRIELHVFGDNAIARQLYRSLGFVETDVLMRLDL
jgi:ribosomal protein S18 acetylase RimI-like enzyme